MEDQTLTCVDCRREFNFTAGEQAFFNSKRLSPPKRCPECRKGRRDSIIPAKENHGTGR